MEETAHTIVARDQAARKVRFLVKCNTKQLTGRKSSVHARKDNLD